MGIPGEKDFAVKILDHFFDVGYNGEGFGRAQRTVYEIVLHIHDYKYFQEKPPHQILLQYIKGFERLQESIKREEKMIKTLAIYNKL